MTIHIDGFSHAQFVEIVKLLVQIEGKMPTIQEVKDAVNQTVQQVKDQITASVTDEISKVSAQITALKDQIAAGAQVSTDDLNQLNTSVQSIGQSAVNAIQTISTSDGAQS